MKKVQIVLAAFNAEKRIGKTLSSIAANTAPTEQWEIIIIDNNSTDDTRGVIETFNHQLPLKVIHDDKPGKSNALNAAIPFFTADLILFTDDDIEADPQWITKMIETAENNPGYDIFAGAILPHWEKEPSEKLKSWIPLGSTFAIQDRTDSGPCEPGKVWGPNMAIRRKIFDMGLRFNPDLGPVPKRIYAMGNDTEIATKAAAMGFKCYFTADAKVTHVIKAETVNEDWIQRRAERLGYGLYKINASMDCKKIFPPFISLRAEFFIQKLFWTIIYPFTFLMPDIKLRFWSRWKFFYWRGLYRSYLEFLNR